MPPGEHLLWFNFSLVKILFPFVLGYGNVQLYHNVFKTKVNKNLNQG